MKIFAVGRVCIDEFYALKGLGGRIESTKVAVDYQGRQLGGSIFNSVKILAKMGNDCFIICSGFENKSDNDYLISELKSRSINYHIAPKNGTLRSVILMSDEQELLSVISINETEEQLITIDDLDELNHYSCDDLCYLIVDLRQKYAAASMIDSKECPLRRVVLDPGSSIAFRAECDFEYHKYITSHSHIIIASKDFYNIFGSFDKLSDYFSLEVFNQAKLLICNLPGGESVVASTSFCFTISRENYDLRIGNTFGAGDSYRGAFLASFSDNEFNDKVAVINAVKFAIAAATLKIEDLNLFSSTLSLEEITKKMSVMSFNCKNTDCIL